MLQFCKDFADFVHWYADAGSGDKAQFASGSQI